MIVSILEGRSDGQLTIQSQGRLDIDWAGAFDIAAKSFALHPLQVYWLLLAISQDQLKNNYVAELRNQCERAALEGYWVRLSSALSTKLFQTAWSTES